MSSSFKPILFISFYRSVDMSKMQAIIKASVIFYLNVKRVISECTKTKKARSSYLSQEIEYHKNRKRVSVSFAHVPVPIHFADINVSIKLLIVINFFLTGRHSDLINRH